jgi:hypothetical protein
MGSTQPPVKLILGFVSGFPSVAKFKNVWAIPPLPIHLYVAVPLLNARNNLSSSLLNQNFIIIVILRELTGWPFSQMLNVVKQPELK